MNLTRRSFFKAGAAAGGGLLIGFYLPSLTQTAKAQGGVFAPNIWLRIAPDDSVTIMLTQIEMGQGVMTSVPMLVAEDLDADWSKIGVQQVGADLAYANPNMDDAQMTAASQTTRGYWRMLREAGATARAMLVTAAAQTWDVAESDCATDQGEVIHTPSGRRLRYGELVERASVLPVPEAVTLKGPEEFQLLGQSLPRLDTPAKVDGSAVFGLDVPVPYCLTARVVRCPVFGGSVASFNADRALAVAGVRHVVPIGASVPEGDHFEASTFSEPGVAVVADTFWAASQGVAALEVEWDEGPNANLSSADIRQQYAAAAEEPGVIARDEGDFDAAMASAATRLEAVYEVPYLNHAPMEPMSCTADVRENGCDVWVSTQSQTSAHLSAVRISELPESQVRIHPTFVGGGFGRRGEADYVAEAVEISKAVGNPVKVVWTREDDMQHGYFRPVTYVRLWAGLNEDRQPTAFNARMVQQSIFARFDPSALDRMGGVDPISIGGLRGLPYAIPNRRAEYINYDPGIPIGFWRSPGGSVNGFVGEGFIDEVAAAAGEDPYEFRRRLLTESPRHRGVLELAAERAGWGTPLPEGRHRGIAVVGSVGTFVAQVAEVSVAPNGTVQVHRVVCAVDCGWSINTDTIEAQMEGGLVYGLSAALNEELTIRDGRVEQSNFHDYPILRMGEAPEVEVHIVPSTEEPGGVGEASTPALAPAVANAIFAATGTRIRQLPIRTVDLSTA